MCIGKPLSFLGFALLLLFATSAQAEAIIYEGFDYTGNLKTQNGGIGFTGPWATVRGDRNPTIQTGSLNWGSLPTSGGYAQGAALNGPYRPIGSTLSDAGLMADGSTLWFSYVIDTNGQNMTNLDYNFALTTDPFVITDYGSRNDLQNVGEGIGVSNWRTNIQGAYWQGDDGNGYGERHETNTTLTMNDTDKSRNLIVGKIDWGSTEESLTLYAPGTDLELGTPILSLTTPDLDQSQFTYLAMEWKDTPSIDEIRFGATMYDVLGIAIPEPSTFALAALSLIGLSWFCRRRKK